MISGINHITLSVTNIDISFHFYTEILHLTPVLLWAKGCYLKAGDTWLALVEQKNSKPAVGYSHLAFSIDQSTFDKFVNKLKEAGVHSWQKNRSEGNSYYFLDPDGHKLEIHCTDLENRLEYARKEPWANFTFFK